MLHFRYFLCIFKGLFESGMIGGSNCVQIDYNYMRYRPIRIVHCPNHFVALVIKQATICSYLTSKCHDVHLFINLENDDK
jgi:hypothetical protein